MFSKRQTEEEQGEFWIERSRVSKPKGHGFYNKLNEHLAAMDFARQVWGVVEPALLSIPAASASAITLPESAKCEAQSCTGSSKAKPVEDTRTVW